MRKRLNGVFNYSRSLHANTLMCMSVLDGTRVLICHSSHEFKSFTRIGNIQSVQLHLGSPYKGI